ncbi:unnamed protein product [Rodentolepis nana]|uniref:RRM domain-containing protein n=1 Tax=Rodentolepis nana TaxID=102285 RepID=A0A0R3T0H8_RODNA|nr:unnamed protein product [Rodentolepis nana]
MKSITRFVWLSNLPTSVSEDELRGVLNSYGKIQCIKLVNDGAMVTFVDSRSASKAIESGIKLHKIPLKLQYCESADTLLNEQKSDQRSDSVADSKSVAGEIDTESTSSSCSSHSSSRFMTNKKSYSPIKRDHRKCNGELDSRSSKSGSNQREGGLRGLKITHLSLRSSDSNLREGLFHEYKKHGKITSLVIRGSGSSRYAHITFKLCEDAEKACEHSRDKVFFGVSVHAELVEGLDIEDPDLCPPEHALDEYHPKATKTLFVGNLCSVTITQDELMRVFRDYGEIIEIDIKMQTNQPGTSYAFVQFTDIKSVVRALSDQERVTVDGKPVKLGFGKSQPCSVVWLDNLSPNVTENFLSRQFGRYGRLKDIALDMKLGRALLYFDAAEAAQRALNETRNRSLLGKKVQIDFASVECQVAFIEKSQPRENLFGKYGDRWRELLEACIPGGGGGLAGYLEEGRGLQKLRHKEIAALLGLANSSSRLNKSYGYSRSSHHCSSRNVSPSRSSVYSRSSPSRDFNNVSISGFRGSGSGNGLLSSLIGLPSYKHESSSRDRSKYVQSRKSVAPTTYDCPRGMSNGGGSYQHSVGYNSVEISPHRQLPSWSSSRRSQYAASTCSDSSSVERKPESLKRDVSHFHKHTSEHQRSSNRRKSSHRVSSERHRHSREDPTSPQMVSSSRRYLRESTGSTPESNQPPKSSMDAESGDSHIPSSKNNRTKLPEPKTPLTSESNGDTLSKLHRERYELLMKLNQLSTKKKTEVVSSTQHGYDGMEPGTNGPTLLLESDPIQVPPKTIDGGADFPVSGSVGSAGQSSSSDPGDAIFSPNSSLIPPDRTSSPIIATLSGPPPPPPPPPPPLTNRLASGVVPSPGVPNHSPNQTTFDSIPHVSPSQSNTGTSFDDETLIRNSPTFQLSLPPFSSYSIAKQPLDSDSEQTGLESYLTSTSIDERIRQLDEQFKTRPHVDYSRFRIRRRSDIPSTNTGCSSSIQSVASSAVDVKKSPFHLLHLSSPDANTLGTSETRFTNVPRRTDTSEFIKNMLSSTGRSSKTATIIDPPPITNHPSLSHITPLSVPVSILDKTLLSPITAAPSVRVDLKPSTPRSLLSPIYSASSIQSIPPSSCKFPEKIKSGSKKGILRSEKGSPSVHAANMQIPEIASPPSSIRPSLNDVPYTGTKRKPNTSIASNISPKSPKLSVLAESLSINEKVDESNGVSSPPPPPLLSKPVERSTSPLKSKKAREGQFTQQPRRQLISPPTTPFERNKLHFKKLPKSEKVAEKEQKSTSTSAPPLKSVISPHNESGNRIKGGEDSSVRSKKKLRRKRQESDEFAWKPHGGGGSISSEFLKTDDLTDGVSQYETMYDKIKRRGNKCTSNEKFESKPEALKSLLKSRKHKVGNGGDLESQSTKPPHLTPESLESSSHRSSKKSRLKRPDSEGGSSSDSDSRQILPPTKRKRFTPVSRKRRRSEEMAATPTKSKTAATKKRVRKAVTVYSSNESANESDSNGSVFFHESHRRRSGRSISSSTTSTPQISRSCSPLESVEKSDIKEEEEEHLPLLEKQITSDQEVIEEITPFVEQEMEREQLLCENEENGIPDVEPKIEVTETQEEREIEVELTEEIVTTEKQFKEPEISVLRSPSSHRSCVGSDLIFTSPLVKPTTATTSSDDFSEESGLALPSSAATVKDDGDVAKMTEVSEEVKTSPLSSVQQPVTLLTPVSVLSTSSTNQHIALVVNTLGPNSADVSSQPTFVWAPSSLTLVSGGQQHTQLIINPTAAATQLVQQAPVVENKPPSEVVPVKSSNVGDYGQHLIEHSRDEPSHSTSSQEENGRRGGSRKSAIYQKTLSRPVSSEINTHFLPSTSTTADTVSIDPYEPNFDESESEVIPLPPYRKDTVTEVINSVIHGEFEQNDYVQRLSISSRISSANNSSLPPTPEGIIQEAPKAEICSRLSLTSGSSNITTTPNDIKLEAPNTEICSTQLSLAPSSSVVNAISKGVKPESPNIDVCLAPSGQAEVLASSRHISAPSPLTNHLTEVTQLACFSDDRSSVLLSNRGGGVQSPVGSIMKKPVVSQVHHHQHIQAQTLIESSQQQVDDHHPPQSVPPPPQNFLDPLQVLTLMTPSLPPTSGESAAAVVAQQISPQVQPQLQDIAASFLLSIIERQAQQQQQRQSEPSFLDTTPTQLHSAVPPPNSDLPLLNRYMSLNENYLLLEPRFLENKFSLLWRGCMSLKNDRVSVRLLYLAGNQDIILSCLNVLTGGEDPPGVPGVLRIAQRMRLESTQLEGVQRKLREPSNYCMCLALASSSMHNLVAERNDMLQQIVSLQNMISYLQEKSAAGIISCPSGHENPYVMHMFPPCDFTTSQLRFLSTDLQQTLLHAGLPYMLIIVV